MIVTITRTAPSGSTVTVEVFEGGNTTIAAGLSKTLVATSVKHLLFAGAHQGSFLMYYREDGTSDQWKVIECPSNPVGLNANETIWSIQP